MIRGINGKTPKIAESAFVSERAYVVGDVEIGEGSNVWAGAVISGAVLNCRRIGSNVMIGMNATVLHEVEIGSFCLIGAGCLVAQGMKVPDNSFVAGVPGEIRGEPSPQQKWWIEEGPREYAKLARQYKESGL